VLLSEPGKFDTWLNGPAQEAFALARSFPADAMRILQEGSDLLDAA